MQHIISEPTYSTPLKAPSADRGGASAKGGSSSLRGSEDPSGSRTTGGNTGSILRPADGGTAKCRQFIALIPRSSADSEPLLNKQHFMLEDYNLADSILAFFSETLNLLPRPLEMPYQWVKRNKGMNYRSYYDSVQGLKRRGAVKLTKKRDKTFIQLTEKGLLDVLLLKAGVSRERVWDGKWRVCIFDIPEEAHLQRDYFRRLLKQYGFYKLQASVFVHPFTLNREAIAYLSKTGLNKYIRFLKVEEMDNDEDLKKFFNL